MRLTTNYLMTLETQGVFDYVVSHLLPQNAQATAPGSAKCMYRAPDGKRCAVGWLIPDDVYSPAFEFIGVRDLAAALAARDYGRRFAEFLFAHMPLLRELQGVHDARAPHEWPAALRAIAQHHGLNERVIDTALAGGKPYMPAPSVLARAFIPSPSLEVARAAPAYLLDCSKILSLKLAATIDAEPEELAW
ncbi:hypothetical protein [Paraburkholderia mimosarum]|uniref:hypothetical protein n=1 Tax=Paraburkholderia mimosarum TaxID=312026 RepID=UPI000409E1FA|nr:hypothetical protein [Paraburkholderia mimosarum]